MAHFTLKSHLFTQQKVAFWFSRYFDSISEIYNFRYPKKAFLLRIEGKVYVKFTLETTGEVSDISFSGINNDELQAEAKRLSKGLINWIPAKNHNRLIQSSYFV